MHEADTAAHPRHLSHVTAAWLTTCLQSNDVQGTVGSFEARQIGEGVGQMATLHRLILTYASGTGPASVVVKFPGTMEANLVIAKQFGLFRREVEFYRIAAPRTSMTLPVVYAAELDADEQFVLLMEDLGHMTTGDQVAGISPEAAQPAIDELVRLHVPFWNAVDTPEFTFAPRVDAVGQADVMESIATACWGTMSAVHAGAVPAFMEDVRERYLAALPAMHRWLGTSPITLIHSDYRLDNLMLGTKPGQPGVVALDWQGALRSKGIEDVAFLLSQSVPADLRAGCERELVERYRQGLGAAGIQYYPTPESAWLDYRKCVLYLWMYAVIISGALDSSNERARSVMRVIVERSAAAITELDCLDLLTEFE